MLKKADDITIIFLVFILAFIAPLILIPLEKILPYPHVVEEIVKAILITFILKLSSQKLQFKTSVLFGLLFATSENMFYLANFITNNLTAFFLQRVLLTTTLHVLTTIIIFLPSQKRKILIIPATVLAMFIHFLYNKIALIVF